MDDFDAKLIEVYGVQIEKDLDVIKGKFAHVIAAHLYAGQQGDNVLCRLNRLLEEMK